MILCLWNRNDMTAISGIWCPALNKDVRALCAQSLAAQKIYGPDKTGQDDWGSISMGRNLKSILPEDRYDNQPLTGGEGRFLLVADIRLDNRTVLAEELGVQQARLATLCDSALLLVAFEKWGESAINRLRGDFAFAVWDAKNEKLILARDHAGTRPLYYYQGSDFIAFASMPKGIFSLTGISKTVDLELVEQSIIHAHQGGERSFFKDIKRLRPNHYAVITRDGCKQHCYWNPPSGQLRLKDHREYVEAVKEQFDRAVAARLRGTNRVAAHLSAGLDSSAVATSAARQLAATSGQVSAYTAVPSTGYLDDSSAASLRIIDEGVYAAQAAALYPNIDHHLVQTDQTSLLADLDRMTLLQDMPTLNLCNARWIWGISDLAKKDGHTVFLHGQMGNMTFSYDGGHLLAELLHSRKFLTIIKYISSMKKQGYINPFSQLRAAMINNLPPKLQRDLRHLIRGEAFLTGSKEMRSKKQTRSSVRIPNRTEAMMWQFDRVELGAMLKAQLGGWGLDYRDPTCDRDLVDLCFSIPTEQYVHDGVPRSIARGMLQDRLPSEMVKERKKGLQAPDWHVQFVKNRQEIAQELEILSDFDLLKNRVDIQRFQNAMKTLPESGWNEPETVTEYRSVILRTISMGDFIRRVSGSNR